MNAKNVLGVVVPIKVFNQRNFTSFALVAFFIFIYWLAGGKLEIKDVGKIKEVSSGFLVNPQAAQEMQVTGDVKADPLAVMQKERALKGQGVVGNPVAADAGSHEVQSEDTGLESLKNRLSRPKGKAF